MQNVCIKPTMKAKDFCKGLSLSTVKQKKPNQYLQIHTDLHFWRPVLCSDKTNIEVLYSNDPYYN